MVKIFARSIFLIGEPLYSIFLASLQFQFFFKSASELFFLGNLRIIFLGEPSVKIASELFFLGNLLFQLFRGDLPIKFFGNFHHASPAMINGRPLMV